MQIQNKYSEPLLGDNGADSEISQMEVKTDVFQIMRPQHAVNVTSLIVSNTVFSMQRATLEKMISDPKSKNEIETVCECVRKGIEEMGLFVDSITKTQRIDTAELKNTVTYLKQQILAVNIAEKPLYPQSLSRCAKLYKAIRVFNDLYPSIEMSNVSQEEAENFKSLEQTKQSYLQTIAKKAWCINLSPNQCIDVFKQFGQKLNLDHEKKIDEIKINIQKIYQANPSAFLHFHSYLLSYNDWSKDFDPCRGKSPALDILDEHIQEYILQRYTWNYAVRTEKAEKISQLIVFCENDNDGPHNAYSIIQKLSCWSETQQKLIWAPTLKNSINKELNFLKKITLIETAPFIVICTKSDERAQIPFVPQVNGWFIRNQKGFLIGLGCGLGIGFLTVYTCGVGAITWLGIAVSTGSGVFSGTIGTHINAHYNDLNARHADEAYAKKKWAITKQFTDQQGMSFVQIQQLLPPIATSNSICSHPEIWPNDTDNNSSSSPLQDATYAVNATQTTTSDKISVFIVEDGHTNYFRIS